MQYFSATMKTLAISICLLAVSFVAAFSQAPVVRASIRLKDGKTIDAHHFGKLQCESNRYAATFTILKGKYNGSPTEISDYKDISKLLLYGFTASPAASVGNQKGMITVIKKNGVEVQLDDAELVMSCFAPSDHYNEIHVQIINPLTEQKADIVIEVKNIESISF
jgi:hypothetical protein